MNIKDAYKYPFAYPKTQTLWKRHPTIKVKRKGLILEGQYSKLEFENLILFDVSEKIDGQNMRMHIRYTDYAFMYPIVWYGGRNDNAQMNKIVINKLKCKMTKEAINSTFWIEELPPKDIMIFGEAYGVGIEHGGLYNKDPDFIVFDVVIDGYWLGREDVEDIAKKLGFKTVPSYGLMSIPKTVELVKSFPLSKISEEPREIEGVVARADPQILFRNGDPVIFKLKNRDYRAIEIKKKEGVKFPLVVV